LPWIVAFIEKYALYLMLGKGPWARIGLDTENKWLQFTGKYIRAHSVLITYR
jgi:hypothetical protein